MKLVRRSTLGLSLLLPVLCTGATTGLFSLGNPFAEPTPVSGNKFGYNDYSGVAISDDGRTALVASVFSVVNGQAIAGKAYIYSYVGSAWKETQEFDDPDKTANDAFGISIALSGDGKSALISSRAAVNGQASAGKAYLYTLSDGNWTLAHEFDDPSATAGDLFGNGDVALSDDGKTAVVGASSVTLNSNANSGETYIYSDASGSWKTVASIPDPDGAANDYFGYPVKISADGKTVIVGSEAAVSALADAGKAYLYTLNNGSWTQSHEFDDPAAAANDFFGQSLALSGDGTMVAAGAYGTAVSGQASAGVGYVFNKNDNGTGWLMTGDFPDPDGAASDEFGFPAGMSLDGSKVIFGSQAAVGGSAKAGKAYVYSLTPFTLTDWNELQEFDDPALVAANDLFGIDGTAISGDGETVIASAVGKSVTGLANAGEVYVYQSPADLALIINTNDSTITAGQQTELTVAVVNKSSSVIPNNVVVTLNLPTDLSEFSAGGAGWTCVRSGNIATCTLPSLANGTGIVPAVFSAVSAGPIKFSGSVTSSQPDPVSSNNTASLSATVTAAAGSGSSSGSGGGGLGILVLSLLSGLLWLSRRSRIAWRP